MIISPNKVVILEKHMVRITIFGMYCKKFKITYQILILSFKNHKKLVKMSHNYKLIIKNSCQIAVLAKKCQLQRHKMLKFHKNPSQNWLKIIKPLLKQLKLNLFYQNLKIIYPQVVKIVKNQT